MFHISPLHLLDIVERILASDHMYAQTTTVWNLLPARLHCHVISELMKYSDSFHPTQTMHLLSIWTTRRDLHRLTLIHRTMLLRAPLLLPPTHIDFSTKPHLPWSRPWPFTDRGVPSISNTPTPTILHLHRNTSLKHGTIYLLFILLASNLPIIINAMATFQNLYLLDFDSLPYFVLAKISVHISFVFERKMMSFLLLKTL
jgi:hypothetical protein